MSARLKLGTPDLLIFDFDGVVADSETIANQQLAKYLTSLGHPTSLDEAMRLFMGKRHVDTLAAIETYIGRPIPNDYEETHRAETRVVMRAQVQPIAGVRSFLERPTGFKRCVASSSGPEWLEHCVDAFGFRHAFGRNLFSATRVANGKPAPDIFLLAAREMGGEPSAAIVIEDSPTGVRGGIAAGCRVIGFLGGSHIRDGHAGKLLAAGAHAIAHGYDEVAQLIGVAEGSR